MRLLTLNEQDEPELTKDFREHEIPPYAILSHRWGPEEDEVTFKELRKGQGKSKPGYDKIVSCGKQARKDNITHFWVDTCCIDKRSSAELSQAINSMYRWYGNAEVCYVHLADVSEGPQWKIQFSASNWFARGWTLQELIAPRWLQFYSAQWTLLGSRHDMASEVDHISGIPGYILADEFRKHSPYISIAQKMSWAAKRQTTVLEDLAYCLLGLFNINMPLLYGEGGKAFQRLQEEIIKQSTDESIFAWQRPGPVHRFLSLTGQEEEAAYVQAGFLAPEALHFADCGDVESDRESHNDGMRPHYTVTNKGLFIRANLFVVEPAGLLMEIHCYRRSRSGNRLVLHLLPDRYSLERLTCCKRYEFSSGAMETLYSSPEHRHRDVYLSNIPFMDVYWMWQSLRRFRDSWGMPDVLIEGNSHSVVVYGGSDRRDESALWISRLHT